MEKKDRGIGKHTKQFVRNQFTQVTGNKTIRKKRPVMQEKRYRYKTQHKVGKTLEKKIQYARSLQNGMKISFQRRRQEGKPTKNIKKGLAALLFS